MDRPPVEARRELPGRKRKSVRYELSSEAIGLEIPSIAPDEERWDQCNPDFGSWLCISLFCCRCRKQVDTRSARTAPKSAPGKKPATTALLGNDGHVDVSELLESVEVEADGDDTGLKVAPSVEVPDVVDAEVVAVVVAGSDAVDIGSIVEVFLSNTHVLFPWHV